MHTSGAVTGGSETILVVEDETQLREVTVRALRNPGYTVLDASDGVTAAELVQAYSGSMHLVITDVVMPQMDGRTLAEKMRIWRPDTKVLFTTGYDPTIVRNHGVQEGDGNLLWKPYDFDVLARKIREMLAVS